MKYDYNDLVRMAQESVIQVTFKKVDGSERIMDCTLQPGFLPEEYRNKGPMLTETTPLTLAVWDVAAGGWRSFRIADVTDVKRSHWN
jgi:hypothetical protein